MAENPQNLNYIFRSKIQNEDTQDMIIAALQNLNPPIDVLPGTYANRITFTKAANPNQFHALLGSKNGAGCAYLLLTHKTDLGVKDITSVTVWHTDGDFNVVTGNLDDFNPSMYFNVVNVANPS